MLLPCFCYAFTSFTSFLDCFDFPESIGNYLFIFWGNGKIYVHSSSTPMWMLLCLWTVKCCLDNLTTALNIIHKLYLYSHHCFKSFLWIWQVKTILLWLKSYCRTNSLLFSVLGFVFFDFYFMWWFSLNWGKSFCGTCMTQVEKIITKQAPFVEWQVDSLLRILLLIPKGAISYPIALGSRVSAITIWEWPWDIHTFLWFSLHLDH